MTDITTDTTTSHLTDETPSHSTRLPINGNQVAGYRNRLLVAVILGTFLSLGISFSLPASAKLYKWVDENGTTHYGEIIPPEYAGQDRAELNKEGRVVKKQDVLTPEQLRAERDAKEQADAKKLAEEKAAIESKRHDKALIDTYSSSDEIDLARIRNLQQIELRISRINSNLKMANENLLGLQKEANDLNKANKPIPKDLQDDLKEAQARLDKLQKDLEKVQEEKAAMDARYDADKARYKVLTGK